LEVEVGVPPIGIHLDSLQAQFRLRLNGSEVQKAIREAVEKVRLSQGGPEEESNRGRRPRRGNQRAARGGNEGRGMGGMGEGGGHGQEGQEEEDGRRIGTQGLPQPPTSTNHPNCLSWAHNWLPPDNPRRPTTL
jgi:hypothetical protein